MAPAEGDGGVDRRARGAQVERAACEHLLAAGLELLAANVNFRCGELDLVMRDRDRLGAVVVFVEVRYRADREHGGGAASIDGHKRRKLLQAASEPVSIDGRACAVSASIGIAMYGAGDADEETLIRQADDAMYRAKQQGRNTFAFHA